MRSTWGSMHRGECASRVREARLSDLLLHAAAVDHHARERSSKRRIMEARRSRVPPPARWRAGHGTTPPRRLHTPLRAGSHPIPRPMVRSTRRWCKFDSCRTTTRDGGAPVHRRRRDTDCSHLIENQVERRGIEVRRRRRNHSDLGERPESFHQSRRVVGDAAPGGRHRDTTASRMVRGPVPWRTCPGQWDANEQRAPGAVLSEEHLEGGFRSGALERGRDAIRFQLLVADGEPLTSRERQSQLVRAAEVHGLGRRQPALRQFTPQVIQECECVPGAGAGAQPEEPPPEVSRVADPASWSNLVCSLAVFLPRATSLSN